VFAVAVALCVLVVQPVLAATLESANRAFDEGKYDAAKQQYEEMVRSGATSANLFYNLGNAEFRLGAPGRAILNYERALALEPSHPEARRNLALVRERTGARSLEPQWYDVMVLSWRPSAFAIAAAVAGWGAILGLLAILIFRKRGSALVFMTCVMAFAAAYAGFGLWYTERHRNLGIVLLKEGVARVAPAEQSGVAGTLPAGSRVTIKAARGEWVYCELPGQGLGWFPAGTVERVRLDS
jgi:tetratricopeptide (TPR) repeat protein